MKFDENSTIEQISKNDKAKEVLSKHIPGVWDNPMIDMAMGFTIKTLANFPQTGIDDDKLEAIKNDLAKIE